MSVYVTLIAHIFFIIYKEYHHGNLPHHHTAYNHRLGNVRHRLCELLPADAIGATVVSRDWEIAKYGKRTGTVVYYVTFLTDDGETKEYTVSEEMYQKCTPNATGTLVTVDGKFFDFGDGEEIE